MGERIGVTDAEWAIIGPLLPPERGRWARPAEDNRRYFEGMLWIARTGSQWRHLPDEYGKWNSIFRRFRRWVEIGVPSSSAIRRMEEALGWLRWLEPGDAKLVWARSDRTPWTAICWRFGIGRATAHRRWQYGLSLIAWRLNGRRAPAKRSRSFVVENVRRVS